LLASPCRSWRLRSYNSFGNVVFVGLGMYVSAIVQVGLVYNVGLYTEAKGGGTEFVFDVPHRPALSWRVIRANRRRRPSLRKVSAPS
jgi:hypothetical protein